MPDTRIENQLRNALRAEADSVPLMLSAAELELRLRLRRSQRANRRVLLGAAAAVAFAVGVGGALLLTNRNYNQTVATSPSPSLPVVVPSQSVAPSLEPSPASSGPVGYERLPSENDLLVAAQVGHPGFVLATSGDWNGSEDTETYDPGTISTGSAGDVPVTDEYIVAFACTGQGSFEFSIGRKDVDERSAGGTSGPCDPGTTVKAISDVALQTDVPLPVMTYADPHASWRVVVLVAGSAMPPAPARHQPSVTCKPAGSELPRPTLAVEGGTPVEGEIGTSAWKGTADDAAGDIIPSTVIHAKVGDNLRIRIAGDVCASSWSITYGTDITRSGDPGQVEPVWYFVPRQENGSRYFATAAENRFAATAREGDWIIHASLQFLDGDAQVYWHLIVEP